MTYNLRKVYNFGSAYPFDWWICPLKSTTAYLADPDLDKLYDPRNLEPVMATGGIVSVVNRHYDIRLHHEFPRKRGYVVPDFLAHAAAARQRQAYLLDKFFQLDLARHQILFVRNFIRADAHIGASDVSLFIATIGRIFDRAAVRLLFINPPITAVKDGIESIYFADTEDKQWMGDQKAWKEHLSRLELRFVNVDGKPFAETNPEKEKIEL